MNAEHAWQATLGQLQLEMSKASFDTWVRSAEFLNYDEQEHIVEVGVKNAYAKDWIDDRLSAKMKRLLTGMIGTLWNQGPGLVGGNPTTNHTGARRHHGFHPAGFHHPEH